MVFRLLLWAALAFVLWEVQDFAASFAAREMVTETTLRTTEERDDARLLRAFEKAKQAASASAELVTEPNPQQLTRDATLTVTAASGREALAAREAVVDAMRKAFVSEGGAELFDLTKAPRATPVPNERMEAVRLTFRVLAGVVMTIGLGAMFLEWRRLRLPALALLGAVATVLTVFLQGGQLGASIGLPMLAGVVPLALAALLAFVTVRVKKAERWVEGRARIVRSGVATARHRFQGESSTVRNAASVAYEFQVGDRTFTGERISIGFGPADNVGEVLKRYPVGREVPVFHDPQDPTSCVLERQPPVSLGCLWAGGLLAMLVYAGIVALFWNGQSLDGQLHRLFPRVRHPLLAGAAGLSGLFLTVVGLWHRLHPRKMFPWERTRGVIVASTVEAVAGEGNDSGSPGRKLYKPVIEFSYTVDGHQYRNIEGTGLPVAIAIAADQRSAEAAVARYPTGAGVDVVYNPENPTQSGLNIDTEAVMTGGRSLAVGAVLLVVAGFLVFG